jgi:hypothetical protein
MTCGFVKGCPLSQGSVKGIVVSRACTKTPEPTLNKNLQSILSLSIGDPFVPNQTLISCCAWSKTEGVLSKTTIDPEGY